MIANTTQHNQQTQILELSGRLNFQARQVYLQGVKQAKISSPRHVIMNLTEVSYIDSAGLGLLALSHKKLTKLGIQISLINPQPSVKQLIELTNLNTMLPIYDSVEAASQSFKAMPLKT